MNKNNPSASTPSGSRGKKTCGIVRIMYTNQIVTIRTDDYPVSIDRDMTRLINVTDCVPEVNVIERSETVHESPDLVIAKNE